MESRPFYNETINNTENYLTGNSYSSYADQRVTFWGITKQIFNCERQDSPTKASERIVITEIFIYCMSGSLQISAILHFFIVGILCICLGLCGIFLADKIGHGYLWAIILTSVIGGLMLIVLMSLATQPTSAAPLSFKVCNKTFIVYPKRNGLSGIW